MAAPPLTGRSRVAVLLLVVVTATWGSTFFLIRDLVRTVPPVDFLAVRFTLAAIGMFIVFRRQALRLSRRELRIGVVLGLLYGVAQIMQTVGLAHTSASVSGFITGTYVVFTPLLGAWLFKDRITPVMWVAVLMTTVGLGILSLRGFSVGIGEGLTLVAAVVYALHILALSRWSSVDAAVGLAVVQSGVIALLCLIAALPGGITLPSSPGGWTSMLYMAFVAGAFTLWAQTWAQAHLSATRTALVMALEPVFAAFFAVLFGGESLTSRMLVGGGLVVAAMYLVELRGHPPGDALASEEPPSEIRHHDV